MTEGAAPAFDLDRQYEVLRDGALGLPVAPESRVGLAVLRHRGMPAWVHLISTSAVASPLPRTQRDCDPCHAPPTGFARALAGMVVACQRPPGG